MAEKLDHHITVNQAANILSVSAATVKNWVRLGKIVPQEVRNGVPCFSPKYIHNLKKGLESPEGKLLKQRRNKKMVRGIIFPTGYISESSASYPALLRLAALLDKISDEEIEKIATVIAADTMAKITAGKGIAECPAIPGAVGKYINELAAEKSDIEYAVNHYPECFSIDFAQNGNDDIAGAVYLLLQRAGRRKSSGIYYTPEWIIHHIYNSVQDTVFFSGSKILDPCCGTGNFLIQLPSYISPDSVYGCDCDKFAITLARINFAQKYDIDNTDFIEKHIIHCNFLKYHPEEKFDFIVGNPPWGGEFSPEEKQYMQQNFISAQRKTVESFSLITEHAINCLRENGTLNFLLPQAILNVKKHFPIRKFITQNAILNRVELLGEIFSKVNCPAIILGVKKTKTREKILFNNNGKECFLPSTIDISADSFNLCRPEEYSFIERMENIENSTTLAGKADFALGIVTGNNREFVSSKPLPQTEAVLKGSDIFPYKYQKPHNYIEYIPEKFQQTAPVHLYKFISNSPVFAYDNRGTLPLNSCNIVIPHTDKYNIKYILAVLNSTAVKFYFRHKFNSVKVLKHHLEQIPIPQADPETLESIIRLTDKVLSEDNENRVVMEQIDSVVSGLYRLSPDEHNMLKNCVKR